MSDDLKVLFVCHGLSRAGWYRCVLPAMWGAWDWVAISESPPALTLISSWVHQQNQQPDFLEYDVVVLQQVRGTWAKLIRKLRANGVKVLYEIDDYVHGIRALNDHDFGDFYQKQHLKEMESCMRECSGLLVSTPFLKEKYQRIARDRPVYVCENGLDMGRYRLTRPHRGELNGRDTVTILWAGATGHEKASLPWLSAIGEVMRPHDHVSFVSIGKDLAAAVEKSFPDRTASIPFAALETYPAAMMLGDIAIAPGARTDWFRAKSDLRAMESAALGIPIVADRHYEKSVIHGETGFIIDSVTQVPGYLNELIKDEARRHEMGDKAKKHAIENFSMDARIDQWKTALAEVAAL